MPLLKLTGGTFHWDLSMCSIIASFRVKEFLYVSTRSKPKPFQTHNFLDESRRASSMVFPVAATTSNAVCCLRQGQQIPIHEEMHFRQIEKRPCRNSQSMRLHNNFSQRELKWELKNTPHWDLCRHFWPKGTSGRILAQCCQYLPYDLSTCRSYESCSCPTPRKSTFWKDSSCVRASQLCT